MCSKCGQKMLKFAGAYIGFITLCGVFGLLNAGCDPQKYEQLKSMVTSIHPLYVPKEEDVETCILNNWWDLATEIILASHKQDIDLSFRVRSVIEAVNQESKNVLNLLNKHFDEPDVVDTAFQWAESPSTLFLHIKFSARWSSPGAMHVSDEKLDVTDKHISYCACSVLAGSKKRYQLDIDLLHEVDPTSVKTTPIVMGRFTITITKSENKIWEGISPNKLPNGQVWWEMKERYQSECDEFEKHSSEL